MNHLVHVGSDLLLPEIGVVTVEEIMPSGACIVIDFDGRRWLVCKDEMKNAELCLFRM